MHFNFIAGDEFDFKYITDTDIFLNKYPTFHTIWLDSFDELETLLKLLGMKSIIITDKSYSSKILFDLTASKFPVWDKKDFEKFYIKWIEITKRENNFDEFAMLSILVESAHNWNKSSFRGVFEE